MIDKKDRFDASIIWPGSFVKDEYRKKGDRTIECRFAMMSDRYRMDIHTGNDWYQIDTWQDAPYFGVWCNPVLLTTVTYCEGDITVVHCDTPDAYRDEVREAIEFYTESGDYAKLDDHDHRHDEKIGTSEVVA